jgi:hypothetical protein
MRNIREKVQNSVWLARLMVLFAGTALTLAGINSLASGQLHLRNSWGGLVFGPFASCLG